jgi:hypothetical protein
MTKPGKFTQADLQRMFVALKDSGLQFSRIEFLPGGPVHIVGGTPAVGVECENLGFGWEDA